MKLIIQIPCFNEEEHLPATLADLPRELPGIDEVEWLVIDDGSTDGTVDAARRGGVDHIVRHPRNRGLARAFSTGVEACLERGADIIVNTDGDNQYDATCIPDLIAPILDGSADMVIGDRNPGANHEFSWVKRILQRLGSRVVSRAAGLDIPDSTSGFRALNRTAATRLNIHSEFSYTLESIIHAGKGGLQVVNRPVRTNPRARGSRLSASTAGYVVHSTSTIVRMYAMHHPMRVFFLLGALLFLPGLGIGIHFVYLYFSQGGAGHMQYLLLGVLLMLLGFQVGVTGLLADVISRNRWLMEDMLRRLRAQAARKGETAHDSTALGADDVEPDRADRLA